MTHATVDEAIEAIAHGRFVLVVDDEDRENEGDLIIAAEKVTPDKIAFMVRHTSGLICLPVVGERLDELRLPLMVMENTDSHNTAFTVSIDSNKGTSTGISAVRSGRNDLGGGCSRHPRGRPCSTGAHLSPAVPPGRRARSPGTHRSGGRSRPPRRPVSGGGAVRDRQR